MARPAIFELTTSAFGLQRVYSSEEIGGTRTRSKPVTRVPLLIWRKIGEGKRSSWPIWYKQLHNDADQRTLLRVKIESFVTPDVTRGPTSVAAKNELSLGAPEEIRTPDPQIRSQLLRRRFCFLRNPAIT